MRDLPIKTAYFIGTERIKLNYGSNADRAVGKCTEYMHTNRYGATAAEVYDDTGTVYVSIGLDKDGKITVVPGSSGNPFDRKPTISLAHLFEEDERRRSLKK
jgi:hypothetical protein